MPSPASSPVDNPYELVTGDEDARVCKDIPAASCDDQPRNFFAYLVANLLTKVADELASAKLILPWLLGSLGAPTLLIGPLVPIREAGVLLAQRHSEGLGGLGLLIIDSGLAVAALAAGGYALALPEVSEPVSSCSAVEVRRPIAREPHPSRQA